MRLSNVIFGLLLLPTLCPAQTQNVSISGVVKDSSTSAPLSGVIVNLARFSRSDTTDASGAFLFNFTAAAGDLRTGPETRLRAGGDGALDIFLAHRSEVSVRAYSLNGRLLSSLSETWNPGGYGVPPPVAGTGVFLYRISLGGKEYSFKCTKMKSGPAGRPIRRDPLGGASRGDARTPGKKAIGSLVQDSLECTRDGYYTKKVATTLNARTLSIAMKPIVLPGGVRPGRWDLASARDSMMQVWVNPNGKTVDSIVATVSMYCISTATSFTFSVTGPFAMAQNGVVAIGDSIKLQFTETTVSGTFYTKQTIGMSTGRDCSWSNIIYFGGGGYMIQTQSHSYHSFTMPSPGIFTSVFYTLRITGEHGTVRKYPDRVWFLPGDSVELYATADTLYGFRGWSGVSAVFEGGRAKVGMNSDKTVVARFEPNFSLTVEAAHGSCQRIPWQSSYAPGDTVKLVPSANYEYRFTGWSGPVLRTSADTAWVSMDASKTVTANFSRIFYLWVTGQHGTAIMQPKKEYFLPGEMDTVRLIAKPDSGFRFLTWSGPTIGTSRDTAWVVVDTTKIITVEFGPDRIRGFYRVIPADDQVDALDFSPDGVDVAIAVKGAAHILDKATGVEKKWVGNNVIIYDVEYPANAGQLLITNWHGSSELWDITTGTMLHSYESHICGNAVSISPDQTKVAAGGFKTLKLFSRETAAVLDSFPGLLSTVKVITFSADGSKIAAGSDFDSSRVFDVSTKTLIKAIFGYGRAFRFSTDGAALRTMDCDGKLLTVDVATGAIRDTVSTRVSAQCAAFSPDGSTVGIGTWNRGISVVSAQTGAELLHFESQHPVTAVAFSPDGSEMLTGDLDGRTILWYVK
jgi:WD40 repeat protein